ncbi:MATE family efflux transporter [Kiritimatiellaeota bacterium B1221]|nr:MATE family efflux transporter [Kiritimatiellaeota bacterium B1221]
MSSPKLNLRDLPVPHLVRRISIPVITGMFFQTMYNVVDTWAAGRISTDALAALSASFPIFFLIIAASQGCQAAINSLLSHALGADDEQAQAELGGQGLFFAMWMSALTGFIGYRFTPELLALIQLEGEPMRLATSYLRMLFLGTPFFVMSSTLNGMLSAHGETRPFRDSIILGFLLNIVLDIWFVFGGLGLPAMGFAGIARATVLLQGLTLLYVWIIAQRHGVLGAQEWKRFFPHWHSQKRLMFQGFPAMFNMLTIASGIFVYTYFVAGLSNNVLAAFGTAMRIEQIVLMPAVGLTTAAMTLAGHSYGAQRLDRLRETLWTCLRYGGGIYLVGGPLVAIFAPFWLSFFTQDPEVIAIGTPCLRIAMVSFYGYVIIFIFTSVLQGVQRPMFVLWIGLYRQLLAPMLVLPFLMTRFDPPELGIWWSAWFCVWTGALFTVLYALWVWRQLKRKFS